MQHNASAAELQHPEFHGSKEPRSNRQTARGVLRKGAVGGASTAWESVSSKRRRGLTLLASALYGRHRGISRAKREMRQCLAPARPRR